MQMENIMTDDIATKPRPYSKPLEWKDAARCSSSIFSRIIRANPDKSKQELRKLYHDYLKRLSVIDNTTQTDFVGWVVNRILGKQTLDAIIIVYGDRGVGKSYVCGYLGERIDKRLCHFLHEPEGTYFNINNVRSVDPKGTLQLLSPEQLKQKPHQVFVIDDASITSNARSFQSPQNQYINYVLTTARIYRHCIIINTIASNLLDSVVRSFADIGIKVDGVIPDTTVNRCKIYRMSHNNHMGFHNTKREGTGKFYQYVYNGERTRITTWYANKPSDAWIRDYDILRKQNTDRLGDVMAEKFDVISLDAETAKEKKKEEKEQQRRERAAERAAEKAREREEHFRMKAQIKIEKEAELLKVKAEQAIEREKILQQKRMERENDPVKLTKWDLKRMEREKHADKVIAYFNGTTTGKKESIRATARGTGVPIYSVEQIIGEYIAKGGK